MSMKRLISFGAVVATTAVCSLSSWCVWFDKPRPRFSQEFDIGGGRTLRVWSIRDDRDWSYPCPLMVYYRIDSGGSELVHTTLREHDDGKAYEFRVAITADGKLACVYETARACSSYYLLIYDAESGESWPRVREDETRQMPHVQTKWRERYRRLKAEFPELPAPRHSTPSAGEPVAPPVRPREGWHRATLRTSRASRGVSDVVRHGLAGRRPRRSTGCPTNLS